MSREDKLNEARQKIEKYQKSRPAGSFSLHSPLTSNTGLAHSTSYGVLGSNGPSRSLSNQNFVVKRSMSSLSLKSPHGNSRPMSRTQSRGELARPSSANFDLDAEQLAKRMDTYLSSKEHLELASPSLGAQVVTFSSF